MDIKQTLLIVAVIAFAGLAIWFKPAAQAPAVGAFYGTETVIGLATTTTSTSVTSSTVIMATTSNDVGTGYTRVYATICNPNANPVYINLDNGRAAAIGAANVVLAAAAGYNACWDTRGISYNGAITASSTAQTATTISYKQYVQ